MLGESRARARDASWRAVSRVCLLTVVVAIVPLKAARAYVDPNTVGPLYQFLFPLLVAITSIIAGLRRVIARFWSRLIGNRPSEVQGEPAADGEQRN